jgi:glyoxylase-like metal-dependent hydrolase (beta-lactamase superfamily II)
MEQISEHVWWLPPGPPDRPSLCAVVGERRTLMLDAGASRAHARLLLDALPRRPDAVVYTHSHWDHVLGGVEVGALVIAHALTAERLRELAERDWTDDGLDARVAAGLASPQHADHVKAELPSPRTVEVVPADIVFNDAIDIELGGVTARVRHVGGAHADDSSVVFVDPDGVLFLGDCLCDAVDERLRTAVRSFGARLYVEGHHEAVTSPAELEEYLTGSSTAGSGT